MKKIVATLFSLLFLVSVASAAATPLSFAKWGAYRTEDAHLVKIAGVDMGTFDGRYSVSGYGKLLSAPETLGMSRIYFRGEVDVVKTLHYWHGDVSYVTQERVSGMAASVGRMSCTKFTDAKIKCVSDALFLLDGERQDGSMTTNIDPVAGTARVVVKDGSSNVLLKVKDVPLSTLRLK